MLPYVSCLRSGLCNWSVLGWRTRSQLVSLHGGDMSVVDSIIQKKEAEGKVSVHPDDPNVKTYFVSCLNLGRCRIVCMHTRHYDVFHSAYLRCVLI